MYEFKENYFVEVDGKYLNINEQISDLIDIETATDSDVWCAAESICDSMGATDLCASKSTYPI